MIRGQMLAPRTPWIPLELRGPTALQVKIDAVLDTGYNGNLLLPQHAIANLELEAVGVRQAMLADGQIAEFSIYLAEVIWFGTIRPIEVLATESEPLVGCACCTALALLLKHTMAVRSRSSLCQ